MPNAELTPLAHASAFRRIAAVAWDEPRDPTIYGSMEVNAERLLQWLDVKRQITGEKLTVTHAVARAVAIVLQQHPDLNAIIRLGGIYVRKDVDVFLQVAIPKDDRLGSADLSGCVVRNADRKDVVAIARELRSSAEKIRKDEDPDFKRTKNQANAIPGFIFRWVLRFLTFLQYTLNVDTTPLGAPRDPFGSAMVTSLGMHGVRVAYAPFFPLAQVPMIILVGAVEDRAVAEDGAVVVRKMLQLNATFDHRIIDGYHGAKIGSEMKRLLENPILLEQEGASSTEDLPSLALNTATATATAADLNTDMADEKVDPKGVAG